MKSSGPVRQLYAGVIFIPQVRDYELGYTACPTLQRAETVHWSRICKRLSSPGIGSKESILPRDVVYLGWPIAPSYLSPNAGGQGELRGYSTEAEFLDEIQTKVFNY